MTDTETTDQCPIPTGRYLYYEGDDPTGFAAEMAAEFGFDPWAGGCGFWCPDEHVDAIDGSERWPIGS